MGLSFLVLTRPAVFVPTSGDQFLLLHSFFSESHSGCCLLCNLASVVFPAEVFHYVDSQVPSAFIVFQNVSLQHVLKAVQVCVHMQEKMLHFCECGNTYFEFMIVC